MVVFLNYKCRDGLCGASIGRLVQLNFDGSIWDYKADAEFVVLNNVGALVEAGSFLVVLSVPETEIRGL